MDFRIIRSRDRLDHSGVDDKHLEIVSGTIFSDSEEAPGDPEGYPSWYGQKFNDEGEPESVVIRNLGRTAAGQNDYRLIGSQLLPDGTSVIFRAIVFGGNSTAEAGFKHDVIDILSTIYQED